MKETERKKIAMQRILDILEAIGTFCEASIIAFHRAFVRTRIFYEQMEKFFNHG